MPRSRKTSDSVELPVEPPSKSGAPAVSAAPRKSAKKVVSAGNADTLAEVTKSGTTPPVAPKEMVIVTGISGAGKASALKAFEDLGYYAVDNLPLELLLEFAGLVHDSPEIERTALVVDVREGPTLDRLPSIVLQVKKTLHTTVVFLEATDAVLVRRYSETRRPHPLSWTGINKPEDGKSDTNKTGMSKARMSRSEMVAPSITAERQLLERVRNLADFVIDTSGFNVHELRAHMQAKFGPPTEDGGLGSQMLVSCLSFGFKNGVPLDCDLVFDIRFLPNPHFVPEFRKLTGRDPKVAKYIRDFPQTAEFLERVTGMMLFLLPHYVKEGKSYLTIGFGCTGGQHRSVMMAEEMAKRLGKVGYRVKAVHRDMPR